VSTRELQTRQNLNGKRQKPREKLGDDLTCSDPARGRRRKSGTSGDRAASAPLALMSLSPNFVDCTLTVFQFRCLSSLCVSLYSCKATGGSGACPNAERKNRIMPVGVRSMSGGTVKRGAEKKNVTVADVFSWTKSV
jgi:hypothetical protein